MIKVFQILEEEKQEAINLAEKKGANAIYDREVYQSRCRYVYDYEGYWLD